MPYRQNANLSTFRKNKHPFLASRCERPRQLSILRGADYKLVFVLDKSEQFIEYRLFRGSESTLLFDLRTRNTYTCVLCMRGNTFLRSGH